MKEKELLTLAEVAAVLGIHPKTAGRLVRSGRLPASNIGTGLEKPRYAVRRCDLEELITPPILRQKPKRRW